VKKNLAQILLVVFEKNAPLILKNNVIEPKVGYSNNKLTVKSGFRISKTMVFENLKLSFNLLIAF